MNRADPVVVLVSGHLVDAPGRSVARFPQSRVGWVTSKVRQTFDEWQLGSQSTLICGGARGADIISAEEAHDRGARVILCLAFPFSEFERKSVALAGTDWLERFRQLTRRVDVRVLPKARDTHESAFAAANQWMVDLARSLDPRPYVLLVWDGSRGDAGGTADLATRMGYRADNHRFRTIDPTPIAPA